MSNYLNHLVMRNLNPLETSVQPRLPSLFEPVGGVPAWGTVSVDSGEPEKISEFETTQPREVTSPRRPTHTEDGQSLAKRSPSSSLMESPSVPSRQIANLDKVGFTPIVQTSSDLPVAPLSSIPHPRQDRYQTTTQVSKAAEASNSTEQKPAIVQQTFIQRVVEQLFSSQSGDIDSSNVPATATVRQEDKPAIAPILPTSTKLTTLTPIPVQHSPTETVKPQITPFIQPIQTTSVASTKPTQPAPTIQVTIGRIEVRATAPVNPPSMQARPKSPVMSLDEYLHQRGGGQ